LVLPQLWYDKHEEFVKLWRVLFLIKFLRHKIEKARIPSSNHISLFNNLTIMGFLGYDLQAQVLARNKIYASQSNLKYVIRDHH
jgi:hypothetical protein